MQIGAQLYTVRSYTQTLSDFSETLEKLAHIGYHAVQVSGTCAYDAEWLKAELEKNDMQCVITHTPFEKMSENPEAQVTFHKTFHCGLIGLGSYPDLSENGYQTLKTKLQPIVKTFAKNHMLFSYHNHFQEFLHSYGEMNTLERLASDFSKEELAFTFDVFWAQYAGADPAEWLRRFSGRVPCIHFKDMFCNAQKEIRMAPVGHGNMNVEHILAEAESAKTQYVMVEQDDCYDEDPFVCLKKSFDYLKHLGLSS